MPSRAPSAVELFWLRFALAFIWLATGGGVLSEEYRRIGLESLRPTGLPAWVMFVTCGGEVLLGLWVLSGRAAAWSAALQAVLIAGFTVILSVTQPELWAHPFGVLTKNLPLLALVGVLRLLETEGWTPRTTWLLRAGMALLWLNEGLLACILFQGDEIRRVAASTGLAYPEPSTFLYVAGALQIVSAVAALLLRGRLLQLLLAAQTLGLAGVCVMVTRYDPLLWLHPFGPVTKNVPVLIGTAVLLTHCFARPTVDTEAARPDNPPGVPVGN
jgi:hypothetical protein